MHPVQLDSDLLLSHLDGSLSLGDFFLTLSNCIETIR